MDNNVIELVKNIISIVGGIGGLVYLGYFLKEKFRKKEVILHYISGNYEVEKSKNSSSNIKAVVEVSIQNDTDETMSLTDIVGTIKYNKQKYAQNIELLVNSTKDTKDTKTERPNNYREVTHFAISPRASTQKTITFEFFDVIPNLLDRVWLPRFVGVSGGDIALFEIDEKEALLEWKKYPLNLLLSAHINGKKLIQRHCPLYVKTTLSNENFSGSLNISDQVKIEKKFREDEDVLVTQPTKTKISSFKSS